MRTYFLLSSLLLASSVANASWFGKDSTPTYGEWTEAQLSQWLAEHDVSVPKNANRDQLAELVKENWSSATQWTTEQVESAQHLYNDLKETAFDSWSDSQLRDFLVRQGVVAPSGPREQLILAAKKQYASYSSAASSLSAAASTAVYGDKGYQASKSASSASKTVTSAATAASESATSLASGASRSATSLASGASQSVTSLASSASSYAAAVTATAKANIDDTKDYVYSTWDNNRLRSYLEEKGAIKTKSQANREELLAKMKSAYADVTEPVWKAFSESYLYEWLRARGIVRSDTEKSADKIQKLASKYYYNTQDTAYSQWSESELKNWLVEHDIIKSDAQLKRDKLYRLVSDNYASAHSTVWGSWKDSDLRDWLIEHGYLRSDAQVKRDELVKLMNDKYTDASSKTAAYLTWPDARLRAYLRAHDVDESKLPTDRPGLLQETRIRWVQTNTRVESILARIRDAVSSSVESAEEQLGQILDMITGTGDQVKAKGREAEYGAAKTLSEGAASASSLASSYSASAASASKSAKAEL